MRQGHDRRASLRTCNVSEQTDATHRPPLRCSTCQAHCQPDTHRQPTLVFTITIIKRSWEHACRLAYVRGASSPTRAASLRRGSSTEGRCAGNRLCVVYILAKPCIHARPWAGLACPAREHRECRTNTVTKQKNNKHMYGFPRTVSRVALSMAEGEVVRSTSPEVMAFIGCARNDLET